MATRRQIFTGLVAAAVLAVATPSNARNAYSQRQVEDAMAESARAWSAGDLNRFMAIYSDNPETSFVTADGIVRGKAAMAARYRERYAFADEAKRGILTFETLDFRLLTPNHALLIARYTLTFRDGTKQSGPTSLVFRHEDKGWKIVADHSS